MEKLITTLDKTLKGKGFIYTARDARLRHGYADVLARVYADRIVEARDSYNGISSEELRHFKIKL